IFYSRRIGRAPQGPAVGDYVDVPPSTTILGAVKLTGRTTDGWTIGVVEAVTGREFAQVAALPAPSGPLAPRDVEVEPLTNYFVGRAQRELGRRGALGILATAVDRSLGDPVLGALLPGHAYVAGIDGHVYLDAKRDWVVSGGIAGSSVHGSEAA